MLSEKIGRIQSPKIIRIGGGVAKEIADVLKQLNLSRPLIVTDKNLVELGHVDLVLEIHKIETAIEPRFQEHFVNASNIPNSVEPFPILNSIVSLPVVNFNENRNIDRGGRRRTKR